jgi:SAM-dependent methyltransferase
MTLPAACVVCGGGELEVLFDFGNVPASGTFLELPSQAYPRRRLAFDFCVNCGLVSQRRTGATCTDYSQIARRTERQLPDYTREIVAELQRRVSVEAGLIIEVGANDGTFLNRLQQAGFLRRLAIEPSKPLAQLCEAAGHAVENVHLDEAASLRIRGERGPVAAVICRHTLEHVPDPLSLLRAIRTLLSEGGALLLEVPGVEPVVDRLQGYELWDEHLTYFSANNLAQLLLAAGFSIDDMLILPHRGSANILCWSTATHEQAAGATECRSPELIAQCRAFRQRWRGYCAHLRALSVSWSRPVIAAGASHLQSNFLVFTGLGDIVDGLADDDAVKIGRWVPVPRPVEVFPTSQLPHRGRDGTVLLTGFGYSAWMERLKGEMRSHRCLVVDPLAELDRF